MSRPRVLMLLGNNRFPQDPRVRREAVALTGAGYHVTVVCRRGEGQAPRERVAGVDVRRYWNPLQPSGPTGRAVEWLWATAACFGHSVRILGTGRADVVHAHNPPDTLVAVGALARLLGRQFVFDHHDLAPEMYEAQSGGRGNPIVTHVLRTFERLSCRLATHVIATNGSYRRVEMERGGVPPDRITIVRNGPEQDRRIPVEPDPKIRAKATGIVGYMGVMGRQDGVDHLLRAVAHLVHDLGRDDLLCIVIGRGDAVASLERLAVDLEIEDHIWFTGYVSEADLVRYLCTADVCVDPDPSNPFNDRSTMLKMMDYMALGRPVVAFDLPEHRVTAEGAAVYVPANDDLALAKAIDQLLDDPERRALMGAAARKRVEEALAWSFSVPHLLDAYRRILPLPRELNGSGAGTASRDANPTADTISWNEHGLDNPRDRDLERRRA